jgi:hypothetical protein
MINDIEIVAPCKIKIVLNNRVVVAIEHIKISDGLYFHLFSYAVSQKATHAQELLLARHIKFQTNIVFNPRK